MKKVKNAIFMTGSTPGLC